MSLVDIAIIDSGVNPWHAHVGPVEEGIAFLPGDDGDVRESPDFRDEIGHGTAIAGIIRQKAPAARFYVAKIFGKKLNASMSSLLTALAWAVEKEVKMIHLSLGTKNERHRDAIHRLCLAAHEQGTVIVAASTSPEALIYPAVFETVIGVYWNHVCDEKTLVYHPENPVEFGAHGSPRPIPGLPQEHNFRGSSFAAAHVTARIARLVGENPSANCEEVRRALARLARTQRRQDAL